MAIQSYVLMRKSVMIEEPERELVRVLVGDFQKQSFWNRWFGIGDNPTGRVLLVEGEDDPEYKRYVYMGLDEKKFPCPHRRKTPFNVEHLKGVFEIEATDDERNCDGIVAGYGYSQPVNFHRVIDC